jgi:hypothetical protein
MKTLKTCLLLGLMTVSPQALADDGLGPEPPSGMGPMITGIILTSIGGANLLTAPVCMTDVYGELVGLEELQRVCLGASLVVGIGGLGVGIPLLLRGNRQRNAHKDWLATDATLQLTPTDGGAVATLAGRF